MFKLFVAHMRSAMGTIVLSYIEDLLLAPTTGRMRRDEDFFERVTTLKIFWSSWALTDMRVREYGAQKQLE